MNNQQKVGAIIAAGGSSRRMGDDKLFARLGGKPLLAHPIKITLRSYSLTQLRNYSFEEFIFGLHSPHIQLSGAESPNHGLNESSLTKLLATTELRC